jgi:hypothetical protein
MRAWRRWRRVVLATGVAAAIVPAAAPANSPSAETKIVSFKGKLISDGMLTVGQSETARVKGLPPKTRLFGGLRPPPSEMNCFDLASGFCIPAPLRQVPGTRGFKTDAKGRATLTFTMPDHYDLIAGPTDQVTLVNGQVIVIGFSGTRPAHRHGRKVTLDGYANGKALVEVRGSTLP